MDRANPPDLPRAGEVHRALYDFVSGAGRQRNLPTTLHLGVPSGTHVAIDHEDWFDAALRADLVERALACTEAADPLAWLTRPGRLVAHERDHQWLAATASAFATHGMSLRDFYVITRQGWLELTSGEAHSWYRVRPHRLKPE